MLPTLPDANTKTLAYLRICVGTLFLIFAEYKVFGSQFTLGGGFQGWINRFLTEGAYPFMIPLLRGFVLRHGTVIAFLGYVGGLFGPVQGLSSVYSSLRKAAVSLDEIFGILNVQGGFAPVARAKPP